MSYAIKSNLVAILGTATVVTSMSIDSAIAQATVDGIWSTSLNTRDDERWLLQDHLCGRCSPDTYELLTEMLADPVNDDRPLRELQQEARTLESERFQQSLTDSALARMQNEEAPTDTSRACGQPNLFEIVVGSPLPIRIEVYDSHVLLHQQDWNIVREIPLGSPEASRGAQASIYGDATAHFEDETLIVESKNVLPMSLSGPIISENATVIERYTPRNRASRLDVVLTIIDPETFQEPQSWYRPRVSTPDVEFFDDDPCAGLSE